MNDNFICYGTYSDKFRQCLLECPDRHSCERITKIDKALAKLDHKEANNAIDQGRDGSLQEIPSEG